VTEEVIEAVLMTTWVTGFPTLVASRSMLEKLLASDLETLARRPKDKVNTQRAQHARVVQGS
jgi:hypothetical protein